MTAAVLEVILRASRGQFRGHAGVRPHLHGHGEGTVAPSHLSFHLPRLTGEALEGLHGEGGRGSKATVPKENLIAAFGFHCVYFEVYQLFMEEMLIS